MKNLITFTSIKTIKGITNKNIKPDSNGYYRIILGALNAENVHGDFYELTPQVKALFESGGGFYEKLKSGKVYAELGHPKPTPQDNLKSFMARVKRIEETRVCAHIKEVELIEDNENHILIYGLVKPFGPYAQVLKDSLDNPDINTAFSIRSITNDRVVNGRLTKAIKEIIAFDMVISNGIPAATKWKTLGIESDDMMVIDLEDDIAVNELTTIIEDMESGLESDNVCRMGECIIQIIEESKKIEKNMDILEEW